MASLVPFLKKKFKEANDVVAPIEKKLIQGSIAGKVANVAGKVAQQAPQAYSNYTRAAVQKTPALSNPVTRFVNNQLVKPVIQAEGNVGQIAQVKNPYKGSIRQQLGQAGNDALNLGSIVPVGKAAGVAVKGGKLLPKVVESAKIGVKSGAGFGAGYGLSDANVKELNLKDTAKDVVKTAGISAVAGGALGAAAPAAGPLTAKAGKTLGKKALDVATSKPFRNVSDKELSTAARVRSSMQGNIDPYDLTDADVKTYRSVQKKLKSDGANDYAVVDKAIDARRTYENKLQDKISSVKNLNTRLNDRVAIGASTRRVTGTADNVATPTTAQLPRMAQEAPIQSPQLGNTGKPLPQNTPQVVTSGLTAGAKAGRQNLSPEAQAMVQGEYTVRNTNALDERSKAAAAQLSDDDLINNVSERLTTKLGNLDDETVALTNQAIERAEAAGRTREAVDLHDALSEQLTASGQAAQAASLLYRLSPNGIFYKGLRDLKKAGAPADERLENQLRGLSENIRNATDDNAKKRATAILQKKVADSMPRGVSQDLVSIWKAGLLSGVKTQQGNVLSNGTFAALKKISDVPASLVDRGISVVTGERTKTATLRGGLSGAKEGTKKGIDTLRTGIDERNITGDKYEQHGELNFKNPVINAVFAKPTNLVFRSMSAADQPFYYAAAKNNLYDLALTQSKNQGLKGAERDAFVQNLVANPSKQMAETAQKSAEKAVLGFDTVLSNVIKGANKTIDNMAIPQAYKDTAHTVINVLAPFTKVPSAFLSRVVDFTPAGPFKEAIGQISSKQFDQRALSEAIGQGLTGTGVIALGIALTQNDLLSGNYPKADPKEAQRWKAEGITPNSVKLGGKWVSLNYLGPLGLLFNAGRTLEKSDSSDALSKTFAAVGGIGQGLLGQSFLQGFSGFSDAISDPERNAKSFINSQVSSVVPAISNDIANVTDKFQRQADTPIEAAKNRIPVLRKDNKIKQDVYGNELKQAAGQLNTLNGVKPSNSLTKRNPVISEVSRLHDVDPKNTDLQVTPTAVNKKISVEGTQVQLTDKQRYDLQKLTGQATQKAWGELIKTPEYKALSDADKAKALGNLRSDTNTLATRTFITDNNLGTYARQATKKVIALSDKSADLTDYTDTSTKTSKGTQIASNTSKQSKSILDSYNKQTAEERTKASQTQADYDYKIAKAKYDNNVSKGTLSTVAKIKAEDALNKAKIGSSYSKDIRELYGLSKDQIDNYVSNNPNGKKLKTDLLAYDNALQASGIIDKRKFKDGSLATSKKTGGRKAGGLKVASLPSIKSTRIKSPKVKIAKINAPSFKAKRSTYKVAKIQSNASTKLKAKAA